MRLLGILCALMAAACALAAPGGEAWAQGRIALLIGNQGYVRAVGPLKNPHNDVDLIGKALEKIGFEVLPPLKDASREAILLAVHDYAEKLAKAGPDAIGFIYYSGHGIAAGGQNYVIPVDLDQPTTRVLGVKGVTHAEMLNRLQETAPQAAHYLVLDACRNNLGGWRGSKGFVAEQRRSGVMIAFAAAPGTLASDDGERSGPYAAALAEEIVRPGQSDLIMFHNVRVKVDERTGGDQVPWIEDGIRRRDRVLFAGEAKPAVVASAQPQLGEAERAWMLIKDSTDIVLLEAYLRQFGDTFYGALARARIESLKRAANPPPAPKGKAQDLIEVGAFYATNRRRTDKPDPASLYGPQFDSAVHFGRAAVRMPAARTPGSVKNAVLTSVAPASVEDARKAMRERLEASSSKSLLVYVHGYNSAYADTALRTAQLVSDLGFKGVPLFFSWPSAGSVRAYLQDEEAARLSESPFDLLIDELSALPVNEIIVVAHGQGARVVAHGLQQRIEKGKKAAPLREILFVAPDINAELFRNVIAPRLTAQPGTRTTIYVSSADITLRASKVVHGYPRLGETANGVFVIPGVETIDASGGARTFGSNSLLENPAVLNDMRAAIQSPRPIVERGLVRAGSSPNTYWKLP